jgi:lipoprotein-anchoring transpeptidase ErfK/SrfK
MAVSGMMTAMKSLILLCLAATVAFAAPKPKKYHFELTKVLVKPEVKADVGATAQPRVEAAIKKAFESHPQLVQTLEGAPDPEADHGQTYRKYLTKKGIAGAYLVTVEITDASEEVVPMEDKKNSQRLVVHVGIHVLGETIPGRTMGFTGDGQATVKQEVGMKIRDKDRTYAWDGAAETAVDDALKTCFEQLAKPQKKQ